MKNIASTQQNIPIAGMKDGIMILNDGQYRIVMEVTAINFALKSEQEQNSLVFQYQGFLNSLHFPIEIVIQSKKLDLSPYVAKMKKLAENQKNDLLKIQTGDYADFVTQLIDIANIMKKRFFVVVGYQPISVKTGILDKLFPKGEQIASLKIPEDEFIHFAKEIRQRASTVAQNLGSMGLHCKQLSTQEMIEEFYLVYNPELAGKERLTDIKDVSSSMISVHKDRADEIPDEKSKEKEETEETIDNTEQVAAEQKKRQNERTKEKYKDAEKQMVQPGEEPTTKKDADPKANKPEIKEESETVVPEASTGGQKQQEEKPLETPTQEKVASDPNLNKNFDW